MRCAAQGQAAGAAVLPAPPPETTGSDTSRERLLASADAAVASLHESLRIAEAQGARLLALRAATSLAQWHLSQGRRSDAQALLAPAVGAFEGGPGFHHLRSAQAALLASVG